MKKLFLLLSLGLTSSLAFSQTTIAPRGLYRYVAGGDPDHIREVGDSLVMGLDGKERAYNETYRLYTDTIIWNVEIRDDNPKIHFKDDNLEDQVQKLSDILNYQRKQIHIRDSHALDDFYKDKWVMFDCSETGFSEKWPDGISTYDKRGVTPLAREVFDVCDGKIPYDANHPLYGTWEVEGKVLNPSEVKIDSIMKGLCTDYIFPYIRNARVFYAFTPQHRYTIKSGLTLWADKLDSDCKTKLVTWEQYFEQGKGNKIVYLNWTLHWIDTNTLLMCRDHQELRLSSVPECLVLKRKVGGESLVNVVFEK